MVHMWGNTSVHPNLPRDCSCFASFSSDAPSGNLHPGELLPRGPGGPPLACPRLAKSRNQSELSRS